MEVGWGGLWEVIRSWGWSLMNGIDALWKGSQRAQITLNGKTATKLQLSHLPISNLHKAKIVKTGQYGLRRHTQVTEIWLRAWTQVCGQLIFHKGGGEWKMTATGSWGAFGGRWLGWWSHNFNVLKVTDLYTVSGWILWYANFISIKLLLKKDKGMLLLHANKFDNLDEMKYSFMYLTFSLFN